MGTIRHMDALSIVAGDRSTRHMKGTFAAGNPDTAILVVMHASAAHMKGPAIFDANTAAIHIAGVVGNIPAFQIDRAAIDLHSAVAVPRSETTGNISLFFRFLAACVFDRQAGVLADFDNRAIAFSQSRRSVIACPLLWVIVVGYHVVSVQIQRHVAIFRPHFDTGAGAVFFRDILVKLHRATIHACCVAPRFHAIIPGVLVFISVSVMIRFFRILDPNTRARVPVDGVLHVVKRSGQRRCTR